MRMNRLPICLASIIALTSLFSCAKKEEWKLVWSEDFESEQLDTTVWTRIPRGGSDWMDTQDPVDERLLTWRNGNIVLRGIVNDKQDGDSAKYITTGIWTWDKKPFEHGENASRIVVRAKLQGAQGAWPAIWLMPFDHRPWPTGGEIDIMERLNYDSIAYQTVHSSYTQANPQLTHSTVGTIDPDGFNDYGVDIYKDSLVFHINGQRTYAYLRDTTLLESAGQFPFFCDQHIRIDQQLGGSWVGEVAPEDLPVEMEVDWVKHYLLCQ